MQYADFSRRWNAPDFFRRVQSLEWYSQMLQTWTDALGIRPAEPVLEVGCGPGLLTCYLAKQGALVTGLDRSAAMIRVAAKAAMQMGVEAVFESGDACALPYATRSFAHVIASSLINIVPTRVTALREMSRVTDAGGTVSFLVPSDTMTLEQARTYARSRQLSGFSYISLLLWAARAPKMTTKQVTQTVREVENLQLSRISHYLGGMATAAVCVKKANATQNRAEYVPARGYTARPPIQHRALARSRKWR